MIIASALQQIIQRLEYQTGKTIKFGYGDQVELNLWLANEMKKINPSKYPLVWYVMDKYNEFDGWYNTNIRLVIMASTQLNKMNEWRTATTYVGVLNPVWKIVESALISNNNIELIGERDTRFTQTDQPNFGISNTDERSQKSKTIDVVDCKIIEFKARIRTNCIIN